MMERRSNSRSGNSIMEQHPRIPPIPSDVPEVLVKHLHDLEQKNQTLQQENELLKMPPHNIAVICDPAYDGNGNGHTTVMVKTLDGKAFVCGMPFFGVENLDVGQTVSLNQAGAIVNLGGRLRGYEIGKITQIQPETHEVMLASREGTGDRETILLLAEWLRGNPDVKIGARVIYDPSVRIASMVLEDTDSRSLSILDEIPLDLTWDHLILDPKTKTDLLDLWDDILHASETSSNLRFMATVTGPPGTGKTFFAQVLAAELSRKYGPDRIAWKFIQAAEVVGSLLGSSEAAIRAIWAEVRANSQKGLLTVMVWDEIESCFPRRGQHDNLWPSSLVNTMLSEMSGIQQAGNVCFLACTNRADLLDDALMRPGRLGAHVLHFGRPDWSATQALFDLYLQQAEADLSESPEQLSERAAAYIWAPRNETERPIATVKFRDGSSEIVPRSALISGDLVRAAVMDIAGRAVRRRTRHGGDPVLHYEDLCQGIDQIYEGTQLTRHNIGSYLSDWSLEKCSNVVDVVTGAARGKS